MIINYVQEHRWQKPITNDPLEAISNSSGKQLRSTLKMIDDTTISYSIEPLTQEILDWFTPLYTEKISSKDNPKIFDIYGTTLGKETPYSYFALILKEDQKPIGATIFSERKSVLSIAYRIYPNTWSTQKVSANPSLYTEYAINKYAFERGFKTISHGRDRNPYGLNSYIGLAGFKLSMGCSAYLTTSDVPLLTFDTDTVSTDVLIFEYPTEGNQITKGYLICKEDALERYMQVSKYPHLIEIETILRT